MEGQVIQAWVVHKSFLVKATSKLRPGGCDITNQVKKWGRMLSVISKCNIWKNGSTALGLDASSKGESGMIQKRQTRGQIAEILKSHVKKFGF